MRREFKTFLLAMEDVEEWVLKNGPFEPLRKGMLTAAFIKRAAFVMASEDPGVPEWEVPSHGVFDVDNDSLNGRCALVPSDRIKSLLRTGHRVAAVDLVMGDARKCFRAIAHGRSTHDWRGHREPGDQCEMCAVYEVMSI
jgi:hypothetical protein